ncbi:hypothetical protein LP417_14210 [Polaromonas sp. P1-6]|nr:hypothetical protein LP417_14210 [Polaromonas sp. P1-6]
MQPKTPNPSPDETPSGLTVDVPRTAPRRGKRIDMAAVEADTQTALAAVSSTSSFSFKVLTVNIHKGFTFFNRKFILPELRESRAHGGGRCGVSAGSDRQPFQAPGQVRQLSRHAAL